MNISWKTSPKSEINAWTKNQQTIPIFFVYHNSRQIIVYSYIAKVFKSHISVQKAWLSTTISLTSSAFISNMSTYNWRFAQSIVHLLADVTVIFLFLLIWSCSWFLNLSVFVQYLKNWLLLNSLQSSINYDTCQGLCSNLVPQRQIHYI